MPPLNGLPSTGCIPAPHLSMGTPGPTIVMPAAACSMMAALPIPFLAQGIPSHSPPLTAGVQKAPHAPMIGHGLEHIVVRMDAIDGHTRRQINAGHAANQRSQCWLMALRSWVFYAPHSVRGPPRHPAAGKAVCQWRGWPLHPSLLLRRGRPTVAALGRHVRISRCGPHACGYCRCARPWGPANLFRDLQYRRPHCKAAVRFAEGGPVEILAPPGIAASGCPGFRAHSIAGVAIDFCNFSTPGVSGGMWLLNSSH